MPGHMTHHMPGHMTHYMPGHMTHHILGHITNPKLLLQFLLGMVLHTVKCQLQLALKPIPLLPQCLLDELL